MAATNADKIGVPVFPDTRKFAEELKTYLKGLEKQLKAVVKLELGETVKFRESIKAVVAEVNRDRIALRVNAETGAARAELEVLTHEPREVEVKAKVDKKSLSDITSSIGKIGSTIGGLTMGGLKFAGVAEGIVGVGSAAIATVGNVASLTSSLGALLGVAALAPAALAAIGAAGLTLGAALSGTGTALSAIDAKKKSDNSSAQKTDPRLAAMQMTQAQQAVADAQESAAQSHVTSLKNIEQAQRNETKSVEDAGLAQDNLNKAIAEARKNIRDLNVEYAAASVQQRKAAQDLQAAQDAYDLARFDPAKTASAVETARIARDAAAVALKEQTNKVGDLATKTADANKKGVQGADNVKAAQRQVRDANQGVIDSQVALKDSYVQYAQQAKQSSQAVRNAENAVLTLEIQRADATRQANAAVVDAMKDLSPSARMAVIALSQVRDMGKEVQQVAQEGFFKGFSAPLLSMVTTLLPQLKEGVGNIASSMGKGVQELFGGLEKSLGGGALGTMLDNFATSFSIANKAIKPLVDAFTTLSVVGSKFMPQLAQGWADMATRFDNFIKKVAGNGELEKFIQGGIDAFKQLGSILESSLGILGSIGKAAGAAGGSTLGTLADTLKKVSDIMNEPKFQKAMTTIFQGAFEAMDGMGKALKPLGDMLVAMAPFLKTIMGTVGNTIGTVISDIAKTLSNPSLMQGAKAMFTGLQTGLTAISGALPSLGPALGSLMSVIGDLAVTLGPVIADLITQLAPVLGVLLESLKPLIASLGKLGKDAMPVAITVIQAAAGIFMALVGMTTLLVDGLAQIFRGMQRVFDPKNWETIGKNIGDFFGNTIGMFSDFFKNTDGMLKDWRSGIVGGVQDMLRGIGEWLGKLPETIGNAFAGAGKWLYEAGQNMISGLFSGLNSMAGKIGEFFLSILPGWMVNPFKQALGIHSPSRLFAEFGVNVAEGAINGVASKQADLDAQMRTMVRVPDMPDFGSTSSGADAASTGFHKQPVVKAYFQNEVNPDAAVAALTRRFGRGF